MPTLADMPVVVFTGRELSAEEDAQLHTMARSIVVKGVESPERLLDETALFLHRVITDLPRGKAAHAGAAAQSPTRIWSAAPCCWSTTTRATSSRCRACSSAAACTCSPRRPAREAITLIEQTPALAIVLMDIMMPEMDGYQTIETIRQNPAYPPSADHRADRQGDEGRPREMPARPAPPIISPSRSTPSSCCRRCACGCTARAMAMSGKAPKPVNVLLVDDQPAKLLSLRGDAGRAGRESGQGAVGARSVGISAQERRRRDADRRLHAGARWLRARGDDPRASALPARPRSSSSPPSI